MYVMTQELSSPLSATVELIGDYIDLRATGDVQLRGPADLWAWVANHDMEWRVMKHSAAEQFLTPIPLPEASAWREEAGYKYGDDFPKRLGIGLDFTETPRRPGGMFEGRDSLIRFNLFLPKKENKKTFVPFGLAVHFAIGSDPDIAGQIDWPRLHMRVGARQISEHGATLDTRSSQELLLVATRKLMEKKIAEQTNSQAPKRSRFKLLSK